MSDMRYYETFYGVHLDDWSEDFGTRFSDHHKLLVKDYVNQGCSCGTSSSVTNTIEFLYPHHIKREYWVEGAIEGHLTVAASGCTTTITKYRVSLRKLHKTDVGIDDELASTGWITVSDTLGWNTTYSIGEEMVYPFSIDCWDEAKKLDENERFYVRLEVDADACGVFWHSNDSTWEDFKIIIPFIM